MVARTANAPANCWLGTHPPYAELTGRRVSTAVMRMYRTRWSLEEIMLSLSEFRGPHDHNEDTELTWTVLTEETENILQLAQ